MSEGPESRESTPHWFRFRISSLLSTMLAVALVIVAFRRYYGIALQPSGALAGALLLTIGIAVGTVIATQPGPRWIAIAVNMLFFVGLVNGFIVHLGDQLTMWAFLCMSTGMLVGLIYRDQQPASMQEYD